MVATSYIHKSTELGEKYSLILTFIFGMTIVPLILSYTRALLSRNDKNGEEIENSNMSKSNTIIYTDKNKNWKTQGHLFEGNKKNLS